MRGRARRLTDPKDLLHAAELFLKKFPQVADYVHGDAEEMAFFRIEPEIISLLDYPQPAGFAMGDHDDHLHIGFRPMAGSDAPGGSIASTLGAEQWEKLTERLGQITNPDVPTTPSDDSLPVKSDEDEDEGN